MKVQEGIIGKWRKKGKDKMERFHQDTNIAQSGYQK